MTLLKARYWPAPAPARLVNAVLFNITWFAIVVTQSSRLAPAIVLVYLVAHFRFMGRGRAELYLIVAVTVFGACVDQVLFRTGVFNLTGQPAMAPLWLSCLWPVFATTLMHAFARYSVRPAQAGMSWTTRNWRSKLLTRT